MYVLVPTLRHYSMSYQPYWIEEYVLWRKGLSLFQPIEMGSVAFGSFSNEKWTGLQKSLRAELLASTPMTNVMKANADAGFSYMQGIFEMGSLCVSGSARPVSAAQPLLRD